MALPVAPELFDVVIVYAKELEQGKLKPERLVSTSPALTFCDNFYAQFFQNEIGKEITSFSPETKKLAVECRLQLKESGAPASTVQLITLFEKLCDDYQDILSLGYGASTKATFLDFHTKYLLKLIGRASAWAEDRKYAEIKQKADLAMAAMTGALHTVQK